MRALLACLLMVAACKGSHDDGQVTGSGKASGSSRAELADAEQARFDAERQPAKLVEALGLAPGARVADIGAGSGLLTVHLARAVTPGGRVVATDVDGAVLDLLDQRLKATGLSELVERRVVAADAPGLEPGLYDAILLAEVDHYFPDQVGWLSAAARALRPGGRLVISNRVYHREKVMASAAKARLVLSSESTPTPTHYIAVFGAPPESPR